MELSFEKSKELACIIELIKMPLQEFDIEYAKEAVKEFRKQANWQESAAVLNAAHNPLKNDLLHKQATCLDHLIKFIESAKECDEIKNKIGESEETRRKVMSLFI